MPCLILFLFFSTLLIFYLLYAVVLYTYDLVQPLIDCPANVLVFDRTGFLRHVQIQLQSIRAHTVLDVYVQVCANVNIREL